jgi:type IV pilus assembly protein PilW
MKSESSFVLKRSGQQGFTLIELLISIALGLAVLVALASVYVVAKQSFRFQETSGRMQEDANFALETISRDLRMAGYAGCMGVETITVGAVTTTYPNMGLAASPSAITGPNPLATVFSGATPADMAIKARPLAAANFIRGWDSIPSAMFASSAPSYANTGALYFAGGSAKAVSISVAMAADDSALTIAGDKYSWSGKEYYMVVSDCNSSSLFGGKVAASGLSIAHDAIFGNTTDKFPTDYKYGADALVMPLEWNLYYAAIRTGADTPSLYRVNYDGNARNANPLELVANVETLVFHYGENTKGKDTATSLSCNLSAGAATCAPTFQTDEWRKTAAAVTDWSRVVAVRIGMMMVSADANATADLAAPALTLLGDAYTVPVTATGSRVRKEYSTTVVLRNRVPAR